MQMLNYENTYHDVKCKRVCINTKHVKIDISTNKRITTGIKKISMITCKNNVGKSQVRPQKCIKIKNISNNQNLKHKGDRV